MQHYPKRKQMNNVKVLNLKASRFTPNKALFHSKVARTLKRQYRIGIFIIYI